MASASDTAARAASQPLGRFNATFSAFSCFTFKLADTLRTRAWRKIGGSMHSMDWTPAGRVPGQP